MLTARVASWSDVCFDEGAGGAEEGVAALLELAATRVVTSCSRSSMPTSMMGVEVGGWREEVDGSTRQCS